MLQAGACLRLEIARGGAERLTVTDVGGDRAECEVTVIQQRAGKLF